LFGEEGILNSYDEIIEKLEKIKEKVESKNPPALVKINILKVYMISKLQHQLFHIKPTLLQEIRIMKLIKGFIYGSAYKVSNQRSALQFHLRGIGFQFNPVRQRCFVLKRCQWMLDSPFSDLLSIPRGRMSEDLKSAFSVCLEPPFRSIRIRDLQESIERIKPEPKMILTPTQRTYIEEGMDAGIFILCRSKDLPLTLRDTIWRFATKTLPLYHKVKETLPFLESSHFLFGVPGNNGLYQHLPIDLRETS